MNIRLSRAGVLFLEKWARPVYRDLPPVVAEQVIHDLAAQQGLPLGETESVLNALRWSAGAAESATPEGIQRAAPSGPLLGMGAVDDELALQPTTPAPPVHPSAGCQVQVAPPPPGAAAAATPAGRPGEDAGPASPGTLKPPKSAVRSDATPFAEMALCVAGGLVCLALLGWIGWILLCPSSPLPSQSANEGAQNVPGLLEGPRRNEAPKRPLAENAAKRPPAGNNDVLTLPPLPPDNEVVPKPPAENGAVPPPPPPPLPKGPSLDSAKALVKEKLGWCEDELRQVLKVLKQPSPKDVWQDMARLARLESALLACMVGDRAEAGYWQSAPLEAGAGLSLPPSLRDEGGAPAPPGLPEQKPPDAAPPPGNPARAHAVLACLAEAAGAKLLQRFSWNELEEGSEPLSLTALLENPYARFEGLGRARAKRWLLLARDHDSGRQRAFADEIQVQRRVLESIEVVRDRPLAQRLNFLSLELETIGLAADMEGGKEKSRTAERRQAFLDDEKQCPSLFDQIRTAQRHRAEALLALALAWTRAKKD